MNDMDRGKEKCEILKTIRTYVAEKYGLEYASTECSHKGDCPGPAPSAMPSWPTSSGSWRSRALPIFLKIRR